MEKYLNTNCPKCATFGFGCDGFFEKDLLAKYKKPPCFELDDSERLLMDSTFFVVNR